LLTPPGVMDELTVDAHTEQLRIARLEFLLELAERGNLGGTHEGEVLRPEEQHAPLARAAVLIEGLKRVIQVVRHDASKGIRGKFLSNTQHVVQSPCTRFRDAAHDGGRTVIYPID